VPDIRQPIDTEFVQDIVAAVRRSAEAHVSAKADERISSLAFDMFSTLVCRTDIMEQLCDAYDNQHSCPTCGQNCKECECVAKKLEASFTLATECRLLESACSDAESRGLWGDIDPRVRTAIAGVRIARDDFDRICGLPAEKETK